MPTLSREEIQQRRVWIEQELRIVHGGTGLKSQLKSQIHEVLKSQFSENPPSTANIHRVVSTLRSQIELIDNSHYAKQLEIYRDRANQWLSNRITTIEGSPINPKPTHSNLPLIPFLCGEEQYIRQEILMILSELNDDYQPAVLIQVLSDSLKTYHAKHGHINAFVAKMHEQCRLQRDIMGDVLHVLSSGKLQDLCEQLVAKRRFQAGLDKNLPSPVFSQVETVLQAFIHKMDVTIKASVSEKIRKMNQTLVQTCFETTPPSAIESPEPATKVVSNDDGIHPRSRPSMQ